MRLFPFFTRILALTMCVSTTPVVAFATLKAKPTEAKFLIGGNYGDPSVLKDGDEYYMIHHDPDYHPALLIWESTDLFEWTPVVRALHYFPDAVWAYLLQAAV
ncbi:MAG: family 43 glycosylhydrolase [Opitutales bacterium]|nr:family 43 glycosylhydrolase [Opitutales bacterium]